MAIIACTCKHAAQDRLHGRGRRVMNWSPEGKKNSYGCTVCGKRHNKRT